jgi:hypothetical protein
MVNGAGLAMATMDIVKLSGSVGDIKAVIEPPAPLSHGRQSPSIPRGAVDIG